MLRGVHAIVNRILWTAHREIPEGGAPCNITEEDMALENYCAVGIPKNVRWYSHPTTFEVSAIILLLVLMIWWW